MLSIASAFKRMLTALGSAAASAEPNAARPVGHAIEILVDHVVPIGYETEFRGTAGA